MIEILTNGLQPKTVVPRVLTAERTLRLTGENTLSFTTLMREIEAELVTVGSAAQVEGEYFDVVSVTKEQASDGWRKVAVECEHVGYRLNDISVDCFTFIAAPSDMLAEILSGSGFAVGTTVNGAAQTFSLQEATSKRGLISAYARYIDAEVVYDNFSVSLVARVGRQTAAKLKSGRDILVLKEVSGADGVSYDCEVLHPESFNLGDNVTVEYPSMGIAADLRVVGITRNPYDPARVSVEISGSPNTLESDIFRIQTDMVAKSKTYYGVRVSAERGFEVTRSDGFSKATFNSDVFEMSSLVNGVMTPAIYFDAAERRYKIAGIVDVDGSIISNAITADIANISNAVMEHADVGSLVADEITTMTAEIVALVAERIDVSGLVAEEIEANAAEIADAVIAQLTAESAGIADLAVDELNTNYGGGKDDYIHIHDEEIEFKSGEYTKARFAFAEIGGTKIPALILGAGDGAGGSRGMLYKHTAGLRIGYITGSGGSGENFADFGEDGVTLQSGGGTYLLDLADGADGQVLKKQGGAIIWADTGSGDWGNANLVILDHTPTESDVAGANENALFIVYDIKDAVARWGSSAFDAAREQGYAGGEAEYNDALLQVGNMEAVLDAILGEEL
jgi:hypothetical protein